MQQMIHDEVVTYEVAKLAKEKGFPQKFNYIHFAPRYGYYNHKGELDGDLRNILKLRIKKEPVPDGMQPINAPTQSLLQRWLREEKELHIEIVATASGYIWLLDKTNGTSIADSDHHGTMANEDSGCYDTYELALEDALKYALKNLL